MSLSLLIYLYSLGILFLSLVISVAVLSFVRKKNVSLRDELAAEKHRRRSQSTKYGQLSEQFIPLLEAYPGNPKDFRFLGSPVDGVGFEKDKIIIAEFKVSNSRLTDNQKRIKKIIEDGNVEFVEVRINEKNSDLLNRKKLFSSNNYQITELLNSAN